MQGSVCQPSVPSIKKGWRATTSDQPERFEPIHTFQTFQDGRPPSIERNSGTRRLSMQVGPQRRLFLCPIEQTVKEICTFRMGRFPVRKSLSVFWTWSSPRVVTKLIKVPVSILHTSYIRVIVYLDDFLILKKTLEETILSKDTVIYLLQNLGFVINLRKSVLHPTQRIEFLEMIIGPVEMTVSLPQKRVESIFKKCQDIMSMQELAIKVLAKLLGTLSSTALAFLPAPLYMRYLQKQQIHNLCLKRDYNSKVALDPISKEELNW